MKFQTRRGPDVEAIQWTGKNIREVRKELKPSDEQMLWVLRVPVGYWIIKTGDKNLNSLPPEVFGARFEPKVEQRTFSGGTSVPSGSLVAMIDIESIFNVGSSRIHEIAKDPSFPAPFTTVGSRRLWWREDILRWKTEVRDKRAQVAA